MQFLNWKRKDSLSFLVKALSQTAILTRDLIIFAFRFHFYHLYSMPNHPKTLDFDTSKSKFDFDLEVTTFKSIKPFSVNGNTPSAARHNFYVVFHITQGKGHHFVDFNQYPIATGDTLFLDKGQIHSFGTDESLDGILILFTEQFLEAHGNSISLKSIDLFNPHIHSPKIPAVTNGENLLELSCKSIYQEYLKDEVFNTEKVLRNMLELLILRGEQERKITNSTTNPKSYNDFLSLKNLLEENYNKEKKVGFYAKEMGFSKKKINDLCRAFTDFSAKQFIDHHIILEMKRVLRTENVTINELSWQMGFDETTNMIKYFKKHTGLTPKQFMNT